MRKQINLLIALIFLGISTSVLGQNPAPANVASALILKVIKYERNISSGGSISIYVLGNPEAQTELEKGLGLQIGSATLSDVSGGEDLPGAKPSVLFVGQTANTDVAIEYARSNNILSVTNDPELVTKGVTLGVGVGNDGKPKIMINLSSSDEENLNWNADIMKVARTVK